MSSGSQSLLNFFPKLTDSAPRSVVLKPDRETDRKFSLKEKCLLVDLGRNNLHDHLAAVIALLLHHCHCQSIRGVQSLTLTYHAPQAHHPQFKNLQVREFECS